MHYEAQTRYQADVPTRLGWYAVALALKFKIPIETVLILLVEKHAPRTVPAAWRIPLGSLGIWLRYRVVRLWEMDPAPVLAAGRPRLLPWVTLMRHSGGDLRQAARRIAASDDKSPGAQFVVLGGLRYDRRRLTALLEKARNMITPEMIEQSSFYQMVLEKGIKKGLRKGIEKGIEKGVERGIDQGRREEAKRNLRRLLALRFPQIDNAPEIDALTDLAQLEALFDRVIKAPDMRSARATIRRAAGR